jgi:phosphoglycerate transport regulatory protein PgtC
LSSVDSFVRQTPARLLSCGLVVFLTLAHIVLLAVRPASADEIVVLTSFPPSFFEPFHKEFEARHPGIEMTVMQRNTARSVRMLQDGDQIEADVFWASAPDAFEVLKAAGLLAKTEPRETGAPERMLGHRINDKDGFYLGFALSGYGFVHNPVYLSEHRLPLPQTFTDLTKPVYSGHIGISSPSRSGTTHLMIEAILQTYGWEQGWRLLSRLGGNLSTVTARSFGVTSGVARGRFGIGITIDFLATTSDELSADIRFTLPEETLVIPAGIGRLAKARNPRGADLFIDFVLSQEGQAILLRPEIGRIPVLPDLQKKLTGLQADLIATPALLDNRAFDAALSARRYVMLNLLFDEFIVRRRSALARTWRMINEAEAGPLTEFQRQQVDRAISLVADPPWPEEEALDNMGALRLDDIPAGLPASRAQSDFRAGIRARLDNRLESASAILLELTDGKTSFRH